MVLWLLLRAAQRTTSTTISFRKCTTRQAHEPDPALPPLRVLRWPTRSQGPLCSVRRSFCSQYLTNVARAARGKQVVSLRPPGGQAAMAWKLYLSHCMWQPLQSDACVRVSCNTPCSQSRVCASSPQTAALGAFLASDIDLALSVGVCPTPSHSQASSCILWWTPFTPGFWPRRGHALQTPRFSDGIFLNSPAMPIS